MRNYLILILLIISLNVFSQNISYNNLKSGNYTSYISRDSIEIKIGDQIELGLPSNGQFFRFITQGNTPTAAHISGRKIKISKLKSIGNDNIGYKMYARFKGFGVLYVDIDIEQALITNEIFLLN